MKITGPVKYYKIEFRGRTVKLFADLHNSTEGQCEGDCLSFDENYEKSGSDTDCYTFPRYLDYVFSKNNGIINFYFESPYVLKDPIEIVKPDIKAFDYIDQITAIFHNSLRRDKSKSEYMPNTHFHYTDIRDVYHTNFDLKGTRKATSANPFSGSWLQPFLTTKESFRQGATLLEFILNRANEIKDMFLSDEFVLPNYNLRGEMSQAWEKRLLNTAFCTSMYNGKKVHRVAKQLFKLNSQDREMVLNWTTRRFRDQLRDSREILSEWKNSSNQSIHTPIMILIPLSSIIMDTYVLARMLYQKSDIDIFFAGLAHIDNYLNFFQKNGGKIIKLSEGTQKNMRCVVCQ